MATISTPAATLNEETATFSEALKAKRPSFGMADAEPILLFADLSCPSCRKTVPDLLRECQNEGRFRLCFRYLANPGHPYAWEGSRAAWAAYLQGNFKPFILAGCQQDKYDLASLKKLNAQWSKVPETELMSTSPTSLDKAILEDRELAEKLHVEFTPAIVLLGTDGIRVLSVSEFHRMQLTRAK